MGKTAKIMKKRFKLKPHSGKVIRKKSFQSHYNSNDRGDERRGKRRDETLSKGDAKKVVALIN